MGIFDQVQDDYKVSGLRQDDKTGVYWQRIDKIETFNTREKGEAIRVSKTTIRVINDGDGMAQSAGVSTTQCFFASPYLTKELKLSCKAAFDLTGEEADALTGAEMETKLTDGSLHGEVLEITAKEMLSKANKPFTKITWNRRVSPLELDNKLTEVEKAEFYPEGVIA